jgi:hypothetical protein
MVRPYQNEDLSLRYLVVSFVSLMGDSSTLISQLQHLTLTNIQGYRDVFLFSRVSLKHLISVYTSISILFHSEF